MANVHDVAAYILTKTGRMTVMKLQKLVYYSQAWHLAWEEVPLFTERIEAWANGPVVPALYYEHKGRFEVENWPKGDPNRLTENEQESIVGVLDEYARFAPWQLSQLTHVEEPWKTARNGLPLGARGDREIRPESMRNYYAGLLGSE